MIFRVVRRKSNDIHNSQVFRLAIQVEQINIDRNSFFAGKHKNSTKSSIQHLLQHVQIQDRSTSFETKLKSSMANLSRPRHHTIYKDKTSSDELSRKSFLWGRLGPCSRTPNAPLSCCLRGCSHMLNNRLPCTELHDFPTCQL